MGRVSRAVMATGRRAVGRTDSAALVSWRGDYPELSKPSAYLAALVNEGLSPT